MRRWYAVTLLIGVALPALGADPTGRVETSLGAKGDIWVGQHVPLSVKVIAPGFSFDGIPSFGIPDVSGLIIVKRSGSPSIGNETIEDVTYVTQTHDFGLYPQRAGPFTLPRFPVRFSSSAGYGKPVTPFEVTTETLKFSAKLPPGAEGLRMLISTNRLTFSESWSPEIDSVKVGDAVMRTITMEAEDIPGMEFPPLTFEPIAGVGVYPKEARVIDASDRGPSVGQRVESVTYVFERAGSYSLPGLSLTWWNVDKNALRHETLPAKTISVTGPSNELAASTDGPSPEIRHSIWTWVASTIAILGALCIAVVISRRLRSADSEHEEASFEAFETACDSNDLRRIFATLTAWLDAANSTPHPVTVTHWAAQSRDAELVDLVNRLESDLFQRPVGADIAPFPGRKLAARVRTVRRRVAGCGGITSNNSTLPPLNPLWRSC
jgi:hypothetical protein